jgi:hypothetical protein
LTGVNAIFVTRVFRAIWFPPLLIRVTPRCFARPAFIARDRD